MVAFIDGMGCEECTAKDDLTEERIRFFWVLQCPTKPGLQSSKLQCASDNMIAFFSSNRTAFRFNSHRHSDFLSTLHQEPHIFSGEKNIKIPWFCPCFGGFFSISKPRFLVQQGGHCTQDAAQWQGGSGPSRWMLPGGSSPLTRWPVDSVARLDGHWVRCWFTGKTGNFPWFFGYVFWWG